VVHKKVTKFHSFITSSDIDPILRILSLIHSAVHIL